MRLSQYRQTFQLAGWVMKIYLRLFPVHTIVVTISSITIDLLPLGYAFLFAKMIDQVIMTVQLDQRDVQQILPIFLILFFYNLFERAMWLLFRYHRRAIAIKGRTELRKLIYRKLQTLGIQTLEQPETQNKLRRIDENVHLVQDYIEVLIYFLSAGVTTVVSGLALATILPVILPVLIVLAIPITIAIRRYNREDWKFEFENTELKRKANTSAAMLMEVQPLQEIFITGAYHYIDKKFSEFADWWNMRKLALRRKWLSYELLFDTLNDIGTFVGYILLIERTLVKVISIGDLTFQINTLDRFKKNLRSTADLYSDVTERGMRIMDLLELLQMPDDKVDGNIALPRLTEPPAIELRNVSFKYPRSEKLIFENLNLKVAPGEKIAIVGHNGAGKTTLIKLISRMYSLSEGEILVNGQPLTDLKIDDWYKNIGVLFQDYNTYRQFSAKENIFLGRSVKELNMDKVREAAAAADADDFIAEYPKKFDQILSESYKDGIRPSVGQWQKIAIARFFYRDAALAIFDEPTAAIDAVSEYKIFNRIYSFFENKTVIIVSHRFSTVRNADRIIVMEKGKIIEEGSHDELIALNGNYANAFRLQAEGYNS